MIRALSPVMPLGCCVFYAMRPATAEQQAQRRGVVQSITQDNVRQEKLKQSGRLLNPIAPNMAAGLKPVGPPRKLLDEDDENERGARRGRRGPPR